jgi:hypothetical protein
VAGWDSGLKPTSNPVEQAATNAMRGAFACGSRMKTKNKQQQIPFGNGRKKSKHNGRKKSKRRANTTGTATAILF